MRGPPLSNEIKYTEPLYSPIQLSLVEHLSETDSVLGSEVKR